MIFHDLKAIFIHVERTGGVSIRKHLLQYEKHFRRWDTKHLSASTLQSIAEGYGVWREYFKFAFVRNPYDRLISWYEACKIRQDWWGNNFVDYVRHKNFTELIKNPHPRLLETQISKVEGVDYIGRFENYDEDFELICEQLNIPYSYRRENTTEHRHYTTYYTPETREIVTKWYKEDLEKFNYEF